MRPVVASVVLLAAAWSSSALAQSRVSIEVGGIVSAYDVNNGPAVTRGAVRVPDALAGSTATNGGSDPAQAIAAFEVRPTVTLDNGFLMGVGFRVGQAGLGDGGSSLVGGDLSLGYQHRFGQFMPFIKGMFGFNSYDALGTSSGHVNDLRLDAVLGARLYVSTRMFVAAAAFAGFGDRYGGTVSVGGDVVQFYRRGVMP
ncbi:MAG: hypothetical protein JWN44_2416 [Myxococcales bacterium]|nr:hypothetical protein [Myxococcales bacterium]